MIVYDSSSTCFFTTTIFSIYSTNSSISTSVNYYYNGTIFNQLRIKKTWKNIIYSYTYSIFNFW